jgi:hypothetical protein
MNTVFAKFTKQIVQILAPVVSDRFDEIPIVPGVSLRSIASGKLGV